MMLRWVVVAWTLYSCESYKLRTQEETKIGEKRAVDALLPNESDIFQINRGVKGLIHGDVLPAKSGRDASTSPPALWPGGRIPFEYTPNVTVKAIAAAELAREEYKLRTCIEFVPRTNEKNYVSYMSMNGCFSHVGLYGGSQILSLGRGCETMGIAIHEMMHASGSWHEQSRADRDDYVEILWENIEPDQIHNFDMVGWDESNPQKLPYNYNSIMHYGTSDFGINGSTTIQTYVTQFASVIGQRRTFSVDDATKLNRLYRCSEPLLDSYNCNFEQNSICGYVVRSQSDNEFSWIRQDVSNPDLQTGANAPTTDATFGLEGFGSYMMANRLTSQESELTMTSMRLSSRNDVQCLQFSYFVRTQNSVSLTVRIRLAESDSSEIVALGDNIVEITEDTSGQWSVQRLTISAPANYKLVFTALYGTDIMSNAVVAVDDVSVQDKACETDFFTQSNYSSYVKDYEADQSFSSPTMQTDDGYAFQVKVFPNGRKSFPDYIGLYFGLIPGPNDANLIWPFCNRYVQLSIVDQSFDPLYAMNSYSLFLTCDDPKLLELWERPTEESKDIAFGSAVITSDDLYNTHNYLKLDTLMVSVLVKDMTDFVVNTPATLPPEDTTSKQLTCIPSLCSILLASILSIMYLL